MSRGFRFAVAALVLTAALTPFATGALEQAAFARRVDSSSAEKGGCPPTTAGDLNQDASVANHFDGNINATTLDSTFVRTGGTSIP